MDPNTRLLCRFTSLVLRKHRVSTMRNWKPVSDEGGVTFDVNSGVDQIAQSSLLSAGGASVTPLGTVTCEASLDAFAHETRGIHMWCHAHHQRGEYHPLPPTAVWGMFTRRTQCWTVNMWKTLSGQLKSSHSHKNYLSAFYWIRFLIPAQSGGAPWGDWIQRPSSPG